MTPDQQFWLAMAAQVSALVVGVAAVWLKVDGVKADVHQVHETVNSKMSELIGTASTLARAEGVASVVVPGVPAQTLETRAAAAANPNTGSIAPGDLPGA
jgi:hypothetical protein